MPVPTITLTGTPKERGKTYGTQCRTAIHRTLAFYLRSYGMTKKRFAALGALYRNSIQTLNNDYLAEIKGIAEGAKLSTDLILAINARSEIRSFADECTSVYLPEQKTLGQTWDWGLDQRENLVLLRIEYPDRHKILMLVEAGMIGKMGLNNKGIGVALNALTDYQQHRGTPTHILLRAVLDAKNKEEVEELFSAPHDTTSNMLVGFNDGTYLNIEHAGKKHHTTTGNKPYGHTNHYTLTNITNKELPRHKSSYARNERLQTLLKTTKNIHTILGDQEHPTLPILRPPTKHKQFGSYGTVSRIVMNLSKRVVKIQPDPFSESTTISTL